MRSHRLNISPIFCIASISLGAGFALPARSDVAGAATTAKAAAVVFLQYQNITIENAGRASPAAGILNYHPKREAHTFLIDETPSEPWSGK